MKVKCHAMETFQSSPYFTSPKSLSRHYLEESLSNPQYYMHKTLSIIIICPEPLFKYILHENKARACCSPRRITEHLKTTFLHASIPHHAAHAVLSHGPGNMGSSFHYFAQLGKHLNFS